MCGCLIFNSKESIFRANTASSFARNYSRVFTIRNLEMNVVGFIAFWNIDPNLLSAANKRLKKRSTSKCLKKFRVQHEWARFISSDYFFLSDVSQVMHFE